MKAIDIAKEKGIPVVMAMGTSSLMIECREFFKKLINDKVNILAGNLDEFMGLFEIEDPLLLWKKV